MSHVVSRFTAGQPAISLPEFTHQMRLPLHVLSTVVSALQNSTLLQLSGDDPPLLLPARDPSLISVTQVLDAVRSAGEDRFFSPDELPTPAAVDQVLGQMRAAIESVAGHISLRELAEQPDAGGVSQAGESPVRTEPHL